MIYNKCWDARLPCCQVARLPGCLEENKDEAVRTRESRQWHNLQFVFSMTVSKCIWSYVSWSSSVCVCGNFREIHTVRQEVRKREREGKASGWGMECQLAMTASWLCWPQCQSALASWGAELNRQSQMTKIVAPDLCSAQKASQRNWKSKCTEVLIWVLFQFNWYLSRSCEFHWRQKKWMQNNKNIKLC